MKRSAIWGLGLSFSVLRLFNSQSEGFSQGLFNNPKWSRVELSLYSLKRDANFDLKSTQVAITLANFFYSCSSKNLTLWCFSSSVKKCAKDGKWLVYYPSITLWKQKTKKHPEREGNGLNPAAIFTGSYRRFREFGGCRTRAVMGSSGANGLINCVFFVFNCHLCLPTCSPLL